eukprot:1139538-Pelagomonas_calceolata.AAC.7
MPRHVFRSWQFPNPCATSSQPGTLKAAHYGTHMQGTCNKKAILSLRKPSVKCRVHAAAGLVGCPKTGTVKLQYKDILP